MTNTNPARLIYDSADAGAKTLSAVGSISAGSHTLTLVSNPGFIVGDQIIIATGGEVAGGLRGTIGVGGQWPVLIYSTVSAMNSDTSRSAGTYAGVTATGDVYLWNGVTWASQLSVNQYYGKINPLAMVRTISAVAGNVLTLNGAASTVAATNANVYFDNYPIIQPLFQNSSTWIAGLTEGAWLFLYGDGEFAFSQPLAHYGISRWTIAGNGKDNTTLFSPDGCISFGFALNQIVGATIRDLGIRGNCRNNGYGINTPSVPGVIDASAFVQGMWSQLGYENTYLRCKATDIMRTAFGCSLSAAVWAIECDVILTQGQMQYVQWQYEWADCSGGGAIDCTMDAAYMTAGWEAFRSKGVRFIRPWSRNGSFSINASGAWLIDSPWIVATENSQMNETSFSATVPMISINSNIAPPDPSISLGGKIANPTIIQLGFMRVADPVPYYGIVVNADNPNVQILGTHLSGDPNPKGYIQLPDQTTVPSNSAHALESDNAAIVVDGIRIVGKIADGDTGPLVAASPGQISNCVVDQVTGGATVTNLKTNAEWVAPRAILVSRSQLDSHIDAILASGSDITAEKLRTMLHEIASDL